MRRLRRRKEEEIIEGEIIEEVAAEEIAAAPARRGLFRRQRKPEPRYTDKPLERVSPDVPTPDELQITEYTRRTAEPAAQPQRRWLNIKRWLAWREVRPGLLLLALGLVAGGVFWTLYNLGRVPENYTDWWALVLLGFALLWSVLSLITRQAAAFLAGSALAGISISFLLDAQAIANWQETLVGIVLITVGLGIITRGLLLRQGSVAH